MFNLKITEMKKLALVPILLCFAIVCLSQNKNSISSNLSEVEVSPPSFTGISNYNLLINNASSDPIREYIVKNASYPKHAKNCMVEGVEVVQFTVNETGNVSDIEIINSLCPTIDSEIIRVLKTTNGMWKPGYNNEAPTAMTKEISILYRLYDGGNYNSTSELFKQRATTCFTTGSKHLFQKRNAKKAIKQYDRGIRYLPYDKCLLMTRGLCRHELGDIEGAKSDWKRIRELGGIDMKKMAYDLKNMEGYEVLAQLATM